MHRIILSILIALPMMMAAQTARFGIVDQQAVLESLPEYILVQEHLNETSKKYHAEYSKMSADIDKRFEEFQTLNERTMAPEAIRERRIQEIQDMQKRAQQFIETAEADLLRQQRELVDPIRERVRNAISQVGAEGGFAFIFPKDQPLFSGVMVEDVTVAVRARLK